MDKYIHVSLKLQAYAKKINDDYTSWWSLQITMRMNLQVYMRGVVCKCKTKQRWDFMLSINCSFRSSSITFFLPLYIGHWITHAWQFYPCINDCIPKRVRNGGYGEKRCESVTKLRVRLNRFAISWVRTHYKTDPIYACVVCVRVRS